MNDCFATEGTSWATSIGMCMYGAADLTGDKKVFQAESWQITPNMNFMHCIIYREALASYYLESKLNCEFRKNSPFKSYLFAVLRNSVRTQVASVSLRDEAVIKG
jgi:hypothetical protein